MHAVAAAPNRSVAFATALFEELARAGVRHACICPGSRSTPLVVAAAAQDDLRCWSHLDERSAGFFALGLARAAREPVALVCTSGTAAANFHPAVIEAHYARVPLLVLTADRPPELREWGAGQTVDQLRLFGPHVRWFAEAPVPEPGDAPLRHARALAGRAVAEAVGPPAGPVHLNLPFREPLEPRPVPADLAEPLTPLASCGRAPRAYAPVHRAAQAPRPDDVARLAASMAACERGVIACGPTDASPDLADTASELARALAWPILAEPTSPLRCGPHRPDAPVVATGDLLLRDPAFAAAHAPDFVLRLGDTPTSKAQRLWLEGRPPRDLVLVDPDGVWHDPSHLASEVLRVDPVALCAALARRLGPRPVRSASPWLSDFLAADARAAAALAASIDADSALLEARVVRELADALPDDALLYVSNSMPVRDLDAFWPASPRAVRVLCNRGANGIDGMLSSALGAAAARVGPTVLFTGDLALLHDAGALVTARRLGLPLTVVVVDNGGGGIFSFLPIAECADAALFDAHFRTPHGADLVALCRGAGLEAVRVESREHLRAALKDSLAAASTRVLVVPVDAERNVAQFRALAAAAARAAEARA
ncbi:MAG: 2-succinyl-5-enolpyruvyl-6-hydroxy-3-cyclohexene-1-carboxylic-acid synthase [Myxococcota bacterium]|nr:2-succinyl-5-enolpyruvyl-6-hydroxy-3-cyclohexene-1-carboxylic-acid synthase [Myxococcota bacterium]